MEASPTRRRLRSQSPDAEAEPGGLGYLLPELVNEILSRLPLRDAVRTSVLARAWRRRWESVPSLSFIWTRCDDPGAISGVLRRYSCPVRKFRHQYVMEASFCHSDRWLRLLALRGVQSLFLDFERSDDDELLHTLHPSIFSCRGLTALELGGCYIPAPPPGFTGLPNLTALGLRNVGFPEGARVLELLIATSPLLESLCLKSLSLPFSNGVYIQWIIQAPKLRSLTIDAIFDDEWQIDDLPSLEEADIDCVGYSPDRDIVRLMTGLAHARKLKLSMPIINGNLLEGIPYPFVNLKSLLLRTSLTLLSSVSSVFYLLRHTPELEVLEFELDEPYSEDDEVDCDFLNGLWTDDLFSKLVRVVVMILLSLFCPRQGDSKSFMFVFDHFCEKSNEEAVTELAK